MKNLLKYSLLTGVLLITHGLFSQNAGDLDVSFNTTGYALTNVSGFEYARDVVVQPDNKVLVTGYYNTDKDVYILRYNEDGTLDNTFSGDGKFTHSFGSSSEYSHGIALQDDGKILITGGFSNGSNLDVFVIRLNTDGSFDNSFGGDGIITFAIGSSDDRAYDIKVDNSGKIVIAGSTNTGSAYDYFVARLWGFNGSFDNSFSGDGIATVSIDGGNDYGYQLGIQSSGNIIVSGTVGTGNSRDAGIACFNSDGSLNSGFNGSGTLRFSIKNGDEAQGLAIQPDDKILIGGSAYEGYNYMIMARVNTNGTLDNSFSGDGKYSGSGTSDFPRSVALQEDGKIVLGGYSNDDYTLWRFNENASVDYDFGSSGKVSTNIGSTDLGFGLAIHNWKILLVGSSYYGSTYESMTARYWACVPPSFTPIADYEVCEGENAQFIGFANGSSPITYAWYNNGSSIGANVPVLDINPAEISNAGDMYCVATNLCGSTTSNTANLSVIPLDDASFSYASGSYCNTATDPMPTITGLAGGTFSAAVGLTIDATSGTIDVSSSTVGGPYTVTYTTSGICPNSSTLDITITHGADAEFSYSSPICISSSNPLPTHTTGSDGVYSSSAGLVFVDAVSGEIDLSASTPGTYTITNFVDLGTCGTNSETFDITIDQAPEVFAGNDAVQCESDLSYFLLNANMGGSASSVIWTGGTGSFDNPNSLNPTYYLGNNETGVITLTATTNDPVGACGSTSSFMQLTINPLPELSFTDLEVQYCQDEEAVLFSAIPDGGTFTGSGVTDLGDGTAEFEPVALATGSYDVTYNYTDANSCSNSISQSVDINPLPTVQFSGLEAECGLTDGPLTLIGMPQGGIFSGTGIAVSDSTRFYPSIAGLGVHDITYEYTDVNGCSNSITQTTQVIITYPDLEAIISDSSHVSCHSFNDGYAIVTPSGGLAPYSYNWSNGSMDSTANNLTVGWYSVTVEDVLLNSTIVTVQILEPSELHLSVNVTSDALCGNNNGEAEATVYGGTAPYYYTWSNGDVLDFSDSLSAGMHSIMVLDDNNCNISKFFTVNSTGGPSIDNYNIQNIACYGDNSGSIDITVSGLSPIIEWSNGQTTNTITGLLAGPYDVTVTDNIGCVSMQSFEVSQSDELLISFTTSDADCGNANGSATAIVTGGTSPYNYSWGTGTNEILAIPAGTYMLTVSDDNGCQKNSSVNVSDAGAITIVVDSIHAVECGSSGGIYITAIGASGSESYNWDNSFYTEDLENSDAGDHILTVTDGGCSSILNITVPTIGPSVPEICVVTVDSLYGTNLVVWEKESSSNISHYNIYRETSWPGIYQFCESVLYDDMSEFHDLVANPTVRSWRYVISSVDNCGNESDMSAFHKTVHLTINVGLNGAFNLIWDNYEGFNYSSFYVYRHLTATGWELLDSLPNTLHSYTDIPADDVGLTYAVVVNKPDGCFPTGGLKATGGPYYQSTSNIEDEGMINTSIIETSDISFKIYPNPTNGIVTIESLGVIDYEISNISGQIIKKGSISKDNFNVDLSNHVSGIYIIKLITINGIITNKILLQ